TSPLLITNSNIQISGYGDDSVINASGFAGATVTTAAIQVGAADGTAPVNQVTLKNFKLTVSGDTTAGTDIHGIRFTGGSDHTINNVTVQKIAGQSGSANTARMGIQMLDATTQQLIRPRVLNSRVFGNGGSNYFTDGIHITSDPAFAGVFGYGSGITDAYVEGNSVDYVRETAYVFYGVNNSSLSNNRASRMGTVSGYGVFLGSTSNSKMDGNVFSGSLGTGSVAIGIESFNPGSLKETKDSVFSNNIIDGMGNGGIGFGTGFQIGNTNNTGVHRNTFQNNTIKGASDAGGAEAFVVRGDADDNLFADNDIDGGTNPWMIGIDLQSDTEERNMISGNRYNNATTRISDAGLNTRIGVMHREDSNPTVTDDRTIGYYIGSIWINTSTQR
ncbi:MAG TPA: right-handed parallel beta-helix repeat-containing protein, partial [Methylococcales bacterium]